MVWGLPFSQRQLSPAGLFTPDGRTCLVATSRFSILPGKQPCGQNSQEARSPSRALLLISKRWIASKSSMPERPIAWISHRSRNCIMIVDTDIRVGSSTSRRIMSRPFQTDFSLNRPYCEALLEGTEALERQLSQFLVWNRTDRNRPIAAIYGRPYTYQLRVANRPLIEGAHRGAMGPIKKPPRRCAGQDQRCASLRGLHADPAFP